MLNKTFFTSLMLIFIIGLVFPITNTKNICEEYKKYNYDLSDYLLNVNGLGEVYLSKEDLNNAYVKLYFYTSMYQVVYQIEFNKNSIKGFAEKISYAEPYAIETAQKSILEEFECEKSKIASLNKSLQKYVYLAIDLLDESVSE